jgi:hypothetical protein
VTTNQLTRHLVPLYFSVALALHFIVKDGHGVPDAKLYLDKFDEKTFPLTVSS